MLADYSSLNTMYLILFFRIYLATFDQRCVLRFLLLWLFYPLTNSHFVYLCFVPFGLLNLVLCSFYIIFLVSQLLNSNSHTFVLMSMNLLLSFDLFCGSFFNFLKKMLSNVGNFLPQPCVNHYLCSEIMRLLLPKDRLYWRYNNWAE